MTNREREGRAKLTYRMLFFSLVLCILWVLCKEEVTKQPTGRSSVILSSCIRKKEEKNNLLTGTSGVILSGKRRSTY